MLNFFFPAAAPQQATPLALLPPPLFNACLLKPLICLIKKLVLKTHWGNELNKKFQIGIRLKIKINGQPPPPPPPPPKSTVSIWKPPPPSADYVICERPLSTTLGEYKYVVGSKSVVRVLIYR